MSDKIYILANKGKTQRTHDVLMSLRNSPIAVISIEKPDRADDDFDPLAACYVERKGNRINISYHGTYDGCLALVIVQELVTRYPDLVKKVGWESIGYVSHEALMGTNPLSLTVMGWADLKRDVSFDGSITLVDKARETTRKMIAADQDAVVAIKAAVKELFSKILHGAEAP
jgi:hypothetical protein